MSQGGPCFLCWRIRDGRGMDAVQPWQPSRSGLMPLTPAAPSLLIQHTTDLSVVAGQEVSYSEERGRRLLYRDEGLHLEVLQLVFALIFSADGQLDRTYCDMFPWDRKLQVGRAVEGGAGGVGWCANLVAQRLVQWDATSCACAPATASCTRAKGGTMGSAAAISCPACWLLPPPGRQLHVMYTVLLRAVVNSSPLPPPPPPRRTSPLCCTTTSTTRRTARCCPTCCRAWRAPAAPPRPRSACCASSAPPASAPSGTLAAPASPPPWEPSPQCTAPPCQPGPARAAWCSSWWKRQSSSRIAARRYVPRNTYHAAAAVVWQAPVAAGGSASRVPCQLPSYQTMCSSPCAPLQVDVQGEVGILEALSGCPCACQLVRRVGDSGKRGGQWIRTCS